MLNKQLFDRDPRDYSLEMVANGLVSADCLLMCALKYMSHDDVRDMLDCNELSPRFDEDEEETEEEKINSWMEEWDDGSHDIDAMRADIANGNLEVGDDERAEEYEHETIVRASLTNGQFTQAKKQCESYGLDYAEVYADFKAINGAGADLL